LLLLVSRRYGCAGYASLLRTLSFALVVVAGCHCCWLRKAVVVAHARCWSYLCCLPFATSCLSLPLVIARLLSAAPVIVGSAVARFGHRRRRHGPLFTASNGWFVIVVICSVIVRR
jgi:hypothetical protein